MLEQLAEAINKRWNEYRAFVDDDELVVADWKDDRNIRFSPVDQDSYNSRFIIWGLDRLEELGWFPELRPTYEDEPDEPKYTCFIRKVDDSWGYTNLYPKADTRAEAVARALLAALEGK